jgi:hypothetical protein
MRIKNFVYLFLGGVLNYFNKSHHHTVFYRISYKFDDKKSAQRFKMGAYQGVLARKGGRLRRDGEGQPPVH